MRSARVAPADVPADPPAAARVRVDLQARDAYIANNKSRLEAAFSTAFNLLADARPEDPFTIRASRAGARSSQAASREGGQGVGPHQAVGGLGRWQRRPRR